MKYLLALLLVLSTCTPVAAQEKFVRPVVGQEALVADACTYAGHQTMLAVVRQATSSVAVQMRYKELLNEGLCKRFGKSRATVLELVYHFTVTRPAGRMDVYSWRFEREGEEWWAPWYERSTHDDI